MRPIGIVFIFRITTAHAHRGSLATVIIPDRLFVKCQFWYQVRSIECLEGH